MRICLPSFITLGNPLFSRFFHGVYTANLDNFCLLSSFNGRSKLDLSWYRHTIWCPHAYHSGQCTHQKLSILRRRLLSFYRYYLKLLSFLGRCALFASIEKKLSLISGCRFVSTWRPYTATFTPKISQITWAVACQRPSGVLARNCR